MAAESKIGWLADEWGRAGGTWNVVTGCSVQSPACTNCYAMRLAGTRLQHHPSRTGLTQMSARGPVWTGEVRFNEGWLKQPLQWRRARRIFVVAHGDLFHPGVPQEWHDKIFAVMACARQHTYQVLTKRPDLALSYLEGLGKPEGSERLRRQAAGMTGISSGTLGMKTPMAHVLIGSSVEKQRYADQRLGAMSAINGLGWSTWVSFEPALGPVNWSGWEFIRWMVSGGESGPFARPSHPDWHRASRDWCALHGVAYDFKQHGAWIERATREAEVQDASRWVRMGRDGRLGGTEDGGIWLERVGTGQAGRTLDGVLHNGFPKLMAEG